MNQKKRICPLFFADNCTKYLHNPEEIAEFFTAVRKSEGWLNGQLPRLTKDDKKGCLTGVIGCLSDWEKIANELNKMKIQCLEPYEFQFECHQE